MKRWFRETLIWKSKIEKDEYNKPIFSESKEIKGKSESVNKLIKNPQGQEIVTTIQFYTSYIPDINIGDYISGCEIVDIKIIKDFRSKPVFLEVLAR